MIKPNLKSPEDIVIVAALRTPLQRANKGLFRNTHSEELLAGVLKGIIDKTKIKPELVNDIIVGNVLSPGGGATVARMAALYAGFPVTTSVATMNRQCSSGLQAVSSIASSIQSGFIEIGIGAGVESMTHHYGPGAMPSGISERVTSLPEARDCLLPMGVTSENVVKEFKISRAKQDEFALNSHVKALKAQRDGLFNEEVVPMKVMIEDENGNKKEVLVDKDDGPRETSMEALERLSPAFKKDGTTTAGNSSQVTDGAAAVLLMKRKTAEFLRLPVLAKFIHFAVVGVPPAIMGIGPAFAIPEVLRKTGIGLKEIDIFEINEAFASQYVYSIEKLGIDPKKVNPKGGAIALGHPLGCTGARQIATLLPELRRTKGRYGLTSMCIGTGMGAAAIIENEVFKSLI